MTLRFTIEYSTQWGESLHCIIVYHSSDGTRRTPNVLMDTDDGQHWTADTAVVASRQHPVSSLSYYYQVENGEGRVLRREWSLVPRIYSFDSSKSYVFVDQWRDIPLNVHLYSNACITTIGGITGETVAVLQLPLYRRTVIFRVSAPQLKKGQRVALLGSHPALGYWNASRYLPMDYAGQGEWMLSVNVDAISGEIEYKYVVVDEDSHSLVSWEEGDNRVVNCNASDGQVIVSYGGGLHLAETLWRAAGVVVPLSSLRSTHSYGVGDFGDLRRFVDWAAVTGMKVIQLLPVNDTTTDGHYHNAHPYNITSCFALHPHYIDLEQLGALPDKRKMTEYRRKQRELNEHKHYDYEAVGRVKGQYVSEHFAVYGAALLASVEYKEWYAANKWWIDDYARWLSERTTVNGVVITIPLVCYTQYHLYCQLSSAAGYAHSKGVVLKGDMPIGVNGDSVVTAVHPELFHLDCQTGTVPDNMSPRGQNWGFPTYCWERTDDDKPKKEAWTVQQFMNRRLHWMEQFFDAVRIDHVLGFFRIWEIPSDAVDGVLGHFSPALPLTTGEIEYFGLPFRKELLTRPFINDRILERLFGIHANYVRENYLLRQAYGLYALKPEYDTQQKVQQCFSGRSDENSLWIRDGLYRLVSNVLFVEDTRCPDMYHPRIFAFRESVFDALSSEERDAYLRLYNNYFYQRHSMFWGSVAIDRLTSVLEGCRLLVCAEDLGVLPDCVEPVLDYLRILTLEVQSLPKHDDTEFSHLDAYPYRSVATVSTHDMSPLQLWWEESPERTQRYYVTMLQKEGRAPEHLPAHIAEEIIARHLYCPSMLCILQLQDWLAMDSQLHSRNPRQERINVPGDSYNRWQWRMSPTIEQLLEASQYNNKLKTMITRSKR